MLKTKLLGPRHPALAITLHNLALVRLRRGDRAGARRLVQRARALDVSRAALGSRHPHVRAFLASLARALAAIQRLLPAARRRRKGG